MVPVFVYVSADVTSRDVLLGMTNYITRLIGADEEHNYLDS